MADIKHGSVSPDGVGRPVLRVASYDASTGTLYFGANVDDSGAEADLTDDEMIVIRNTYGEVVSLTVPFFDTYWSRNWASFVTALERFGRIDVAEVARATGRLPTQFTSSTRYQAIKSTRHAGYRVTFGSSSGQQQS